ncbi:MAG: hypothetical protein M1830_001333 [Pleopsidium flavum]|nr:MAG: hypothetical protein M1830_001333 [Pleopsidium flavum]
MSSNVRVFVHWKDSIVFSGENLECEITFKNVTPASEPSPSEATSNGQRPLNIAPLQPTPSNTRSSGLRNQRPPQPRDRGHRPAVSLDVPLSSAKVARPGSWTALQNGSVAHGHKHKRSVSIISLGGGETMEKDEEGSQGPGQISAPRRPGRKHTRSASLQILPRWPVAVGAGPSSAPLGIRAATHPSPLINRLRSPAASESKTSLSLPVRPNQRFSGVGSAPHTPRMPLYSRQASTSFTPTFRFPSTTATKDASVSEAQSSPELAMGQVNASTTVRAQIPRHSDEQGSATEHLNPVTRILSGSSINGTPRSSAEFYSISNNSTETLASEFAPPSSNRFSTTPRRSRQLSQHAKQTLQRPLEALMMGYAQVVGSFTLDGSLVNQAPFEEVKRKGVLGGEGGGGVVGLEKSKSNSGLFRALGWGSIGESIGGLLGDKELSSIKEMREIANSRSVPLLSTPKSILCVNLQLAPGETKSYSYSFRLPRGLPPSHKGKAIKISYHLVLGTQRANKSKEKRSVHHVNFPFRVLGTVNGQGEILGHDLMSPYVPLQDQARILSLDKAPSTSQAKNIGSVAKEAPDSSLQGFLSYVDSIHERSRQNSGIGLLSPTATRGTREPSVLEEPASVKEAIDLAILQSNITTSSNRSTRRFEIARNGRHVAVIMLTRSAYRLGETITAAIDLSGADIPCFSMCATLESSETVDPAIALRSSASIYRVTRRIHASQVENTLFARKVSFSPSIPVAATPEFVTSGVSLEWKLRIRFVTSRLAGEEEDEGGGDALLEEVGRDDRALVVAAVENITCESFEITVPLRVYGAVTGWSESNETEGLLV